MLVNAYQMSKDQKRCIRLQKKIEEERMNEEFMGMLFTRLIPFFGGNMGKDIGHPGRNSSAGCPNDKISGGPTGDRPAEVLAVVQTTADLCLVGRPKHALLEAANAHVAVGVAGVLDVFAGGGFDQLAR